MKDRMIRCRYNKYFVVYSRRFTIQLMMDNVCNNYIYVFIIIFDRVKGDKKSLPLHPKERYSRDLIWFELKAASNTYYIKEMVSIYLY